MPVLLFAETHVSHLSEVVALLLSCVVILYLCQRVGLAPIVAFLLTGVLIGPNALALVRDVDHVETLAEIGAMLLLFTIGMEFSLDDLVRQTKLILVAGGLQVGLTIALAAAVLAWWGLSWQAGVFTGCLLALSSDALALKLLSDRGEIATPAGQATIGVLVFQDLAAVAMILLVPALGGQGDSPLGISLALLKAIGTIAAVLVVARQLLPRLLEAVARTCLPELFLLTVVAICFGTAWLTSLAGVNVALGAFLAGLVVSGSRMKDLAFGEVLPMRTLFSAAFFISLGMLLDPRFVLTHPLLVLGAVVVIVLLRFLTVGVGLAVLGTPVRVIAVAALLIAQVGEFSFVLQQAGVAAGLSPFGLGETGVQAFIAASVLLMALTPFFAAAAWRLDAWLGRRSAANTPFTPAGGGHGVALTDHLVIAGYGAAARPLARMLHSTGVPFGILTLNPDGAAEAQNEGFLVRLGDSTKSHGLQLLAVDQAKMLVCADDDPTTARRIAAVARTLNPTMTIILRTHSGDAVHPLLEGGADLVIAEEMEGIVQLFVRVLDEYLVAHDQVARQVETLRATGYSALRAGTATPIGLRCITADGTCLFARRVLIRPGAALIGQTLDQAGLTTKYGLQVINAQRHEDVVSDPPGDWLLALGDWLVLRGSAAQFAASGPLFRRPDTLGEPTMPDLPATAGGAIEPPEGKCAHHDQAHAVTPQTAGCAECLAEGKRWVHLRVCMTCGHVGCCDSSPGKHATAHFKHTSHPIVKSLEPGETWGWCYVDERML